ncbi:MAG: hypothetical protein LBK97_07035, partial [Prevotellaceae bacterium]|nr:hypothetical protein [Prevotellaceae bacterium]
MKQLQMNTPRSLRSAGEFYIQPFRRDAENPVTFSKKIIVFLCILLACVSEGNASPEKKQDAGLWIFAGLTPKPFGGKWKMLYGLEYRNKENFSETS